MIYETKGLALEQVDELYGVVSKAWKSKEFRPTLSFQEVQDAGIAGEKGGLKGEFERRRSSVAVQQENVETGK